MAARAAGGGPGTSRRCVGSCAANRPAGRLHGPRHRPLRRRGRPPGALRAAINPYYRAAFRANPLAQARGLRRVDIPTLIIWGDQDRSLGRELAQRADRAWVPDVRVERIAEGQPLRYKPDDPEQVNQLMVDFLEHIRG